MRAVRKNEQGSDEARERKGRLLRETLELTDCGEVLEQTVAVARCPASFIRFGPHVVGAPGLFLFNSNARAAAMTTAAATHNGKAPNAEENLPLSSFSSLFSRPSSPFSLPPSCSLSVPSSTCFLFALLSSASLVRLSLPVVLSFSLSLSAPFTPLSVFPLFL